jgi:3-oxoacyl-[acyl-carrier-protein] synthase-3
LNSTILSMAAVVPPDVLTNEALEQRFGKKEMDSITRMSGIKERRVVAPGQCASDLALTAAERLFQQGGFDRSLVDALFFVSQSPDYRIPTTSAVLHGKLGLPLSCATMDINLACSAFPYMLSLAHAMIVAGTARHVLLLNADAITTFLHPFDRSLVALHGDAACATIIGPCEDGFGFGKFTLGTDGAGARHLLIPAGGARIPPGPETRVESTDESGCVRTPEHLFMDGPAIFHFCVYKVPQVIKEALAALRLSMDQIDMLILHQANKTMLSLIYKTLKVPEEKQFYCLERFGNSSGPATPLALYECWRKGRIRPGSRTLICSFGAGLTWGVACIRWPEDARPALDLKPELEVGEVVSAAL